MYPDTGTQEANTRATGVPRQTSHLLVAVLQIEEARVWYQSYQPANDLSNAVYDGQVKVSVKQRHTVTLRHLLGRRQLETHLYQIEGISRIDWETE